MKKLLLLLLCVPLIGLGQQVNGNIDTQQYFNTNCSGSSQNNNCSLSLTAITNIQCFGADDGSISVQVDSGGGMYHFYLEMYNVNYPFNGGWQSVGQVPAPNQFTIIDSITFNNLIADTFRVILEDSTNSCFDTIGMPLGSIIINEPAEIIVNSSIVNATTMITPDGSISINISGGIPPYDFGWTGPNGFISNSQNLNNLFVGDYILSLTDNYGCLSVDTFTVFATQNCSLGNFISIPTICNGDNNGQIIINSVFGTPNFIYTLELQDSVTLNWNFVNTVTIADTFYTFNNLYSGVYRYILTDASGCTQTSASINVLDPTPVSWNNTITSATSATSCNGTITTQINGGVAPFIHFWNGPNGFTSTLANISNLCIGNYCDSIVDDNGCTAILCDSIGFIPPCSPEVEITNVFCDVDSSGMAIVTKTNNSYALYVWRNVLGDTISTDTFAVNLPAGNYTFSAYGLGVPNACPDTLINFTISQSEVNVSSVNGDTLCVGDGTWFVFDTSNVNSSYVYSVSVDNGPLFLLTDSSDYFYSGTHFYDVYVDTGNGFIPCISNQNYNIIENDLSIDSVIVTDEICATFLGEILVYASSNHNPILYSSDSIFLANNNLSNLAEEYYNINVEDGIGCIANQDSVFVGLQVRTVLQVDSALETCRENDGWISVVVSNGFAPYKYSVDGGTTFSTLNYLDTILIDSLQSGAYNLVIRDDSLCDKFYGDIFIGKTPNPSLDSVITTNESCCGLDGTITIFASPQLSIVKYSIDTLISWQSQNIFDSVYRGNYLVYIEDTNTCIDSLEIIIEVDSTPNINLTVGKTDIVCNGDTNGTFKVYYPDSCYSYALWRYTLFNPQVVVGTGTYFNELIKGHYGVIATSNSGTCIDSSAVKFIDEPTAVTFNPVIVTDVRCLNGDSCNGELFLPNQPSGGILPYYYYLSQIGNNIPFGLITTADTFQNLCDGEYEIQVVDGNACVVYDTTVIADSSLYIDSIIVQTVSCFNGDDGVVEVFAHGGIQNYTYLWSDSSITKINDSLGKGQYFVTITDSVGCVVFDSVFISQPDTLQFKILEFGKKPETCMGVTNDGEIYLEITGGTQPYNYMWTSFSGNSGYGFGDTIFNLTFDTITIDVTDVNYCSASPTWGTVNVTIVDALNANNPLSFDSIYTNTNPLCFGSHTGFIQIEMASGDTPYLYSIDNGVSYFPYDSFPHLNANKYEIFVQDVYGCLDSVIIDIFQYDEIVISYDSIKHISCYKGEDGHISVSLTGGVSPYNYFWIPTSETTSSISDLQALPHVVQITDSVNCMIVDTIDLYELTDPIQTQSSVVNMVSCFEGENGELTTQTIGGIPDYNYVWLNSNADTVSQSVTATNLSAGMYVVVISDSFNCGPAFDTILMTESSEIELSIINIKDNICFGDRLGEISVDVLGGNPNYTIYFMDENSSVLTLNGQTIYNMYSSNYSVWVVDDNFCISDTLQNIKLGEPGRIKIESSLQSLSCFELDDGVMTLNLLSGTSPYNYIVSFSSNPISQGMVNQSIDVIIDDLESGNYSISVTDFNNCSVDTMVNISQPDQIIANFIPLPDFGRENSVINFDNTSVGGNIYFWDFDNETTNTTSYFEEFSVVFPQQGEYHVMMIAHDSILGESCNDTTYNIVDIEGYDVFNVFTPNNDGSNDVFAFNEWMLNGIYVEIFNRWGQKVFHWEDVNSGWDGRAYSGRELEEGVYFYRMEATGVDGHHFEENGSITLLR